MTPETKKNPLKRPPLLPFYHALSHDRQPEWLRHLYAARTVREFEQDLQFLLKNYQPISAEDLVEGRIPTGKPAFHLSFDDGLQSAYELAVPLLEQYGTSLIHICRCPPKKKFKTTWYD